MSNSAPTPPAGGLRTVPQPTRGRRRAAVQPAPTPPPVLEDPPEEQLEEVVEEVGEAAPVLKRGRLSAADRQTIVSEASRGTAVDVIAGKVGRDPEFVERVIDEAAEEQAQEDAQAAQEAPAVQEAAVDPAPSRKRSKRRHAPASGSARASSKRSKRDPKRQARVLVELTRFSVQTEISFDDMRQALALIEDNDEEGAE